jgi:hypothetical protein
MRLVSVRHHAHLQNKHLDKLNFTEHHHRILIGFSYLSTSTSILNYNIMQSTMLCALQCSMPCCRAPPAINITQHHPQDMQHTVGVLCFTRSAMDRRWYDSRGINWCSPMVQAVHVIYIFRCYVEHSGVCAH